MASVSPSEPTSDPRWGPPLNEYLDCPEANLDFAQYPDEITICSAIDGFLYDPDVVTFHTLETIMSIIYRPQMLILLAHENAVGGCMGLLEEYAARNGPNSSLFEHAFGFLGLHVLALILQAGLLDCFDDCLKSLPPVWTPECSWDPKAPAIENNFLVRLFGLIAGDTLRPTGSAPRIGDYEIEWFEDSDGDERACLPAIGGFMYRDAVFVLEQLFDHRNMFLECCFRTRAPGWSILIYMIQYMLDDRSYEGRRVPRLWQKHHDIIHRYALVSGLKEDGFMELLCCRYSEEYASTFLRVPTAMDFEDAQLIQLAFTRKYRPNNKGTHKRDLSWQMYVTLYARDNLEDRLPLLFALSETTTEIVWNVLLCVGQDSRWQDVDMYMGGSYGIIYQMLGRNDVDLTPKVISILHKFDVVSMFGRYLLLPSYLQNNLPDVVDAGRYLLYTSLPCADDGSILQPH
ncbi:hypothetical protein FRC08_016933 [Ceratobasidium sp. 394]|nr:hypothetical protein FRC08_016933 [Ceratobasidium sp. 394]